MIILPDDVQRYILEFIPDCCRFCKKEITIKETITSENMGKFCSNNCAIYYFMYFGYYELHNISQPYLRDYNNKKKYKTILCKSIK